MKRYRGYPCSRHGCQVRIRKGVFCDHCRKADKAQRYGLSFSDGHAKPTPQFWRAWRADKDAVKRDGLSVKKENGVWTVRLAQRLM